MKKNILIGLGVLLAVVIIAVAGCGLYLYHINNPKGCVSLEYSNYPPGFEITEDTPYDFSSPEVQKIINVKNSCVAVVTGKDSSVDECSAVNNLMESIYVLAQNASNTKKESDKQYVLNDIEKIKQDIKGVDKASCQAEYDELQKAFSSIEQTFKSKTTK